LENFIFILTRKKEENCKKVFEIVKEEIDREKMEKSKEFRILVYSRVRKMIILSKILKELEGRIGPGYFFNRLKMYK